MKAGLLFQCDLLEFKLRHAYTRRINSNSRHISHLRTWSSKNSSSITMDIDIDIRTWRKDDAPSQSITGWRVNVFGDTVTDTMEPAVSEYTLFLQFENARWYVNEDLDYEFISDSCKLYDKDMNLLHVFWNTEMVITQSHLVPSGLPVLGIPAYLWCEQDAPTSDLWQAYEPPLWDIGTPGTYTTSAQGGWRVKINNEWHAFPVDYAPEAPRLTPPCCTAYYSEPVASAPDTYSVQVEFYQRNLRSLSFACLSEQTYRKTAVMAFPNLSRKIQRLIQPYQAVVLRNELGDVRLREHTTCFIERLSGTECSFDEIAEHNILPSQSAKVFLLTDDPHAEEYLFTQRTPTAYERFFSYYSILAGGSEEGDSVSSICVGGVFDSRSHDQRFPVTDFGELPGWLDVNDITDPVRSRWARYVNSHLHPHWLYELFFDNWELGLPLTSVSGNDYWLPIRQQWSGANELPAGERTQRRNTIIGDMTNETVFAPRRWLGLTRFDSDEPARTASVSLGIDSEPLWSFSGATAVFDSGGITLTPTATSITAEFELGQFTQAPYLYPHFADRVACAVTGTTVSSAELVLVNPLGDTYSLGSADGTAHELLTALDTAYAGSWAQSFAANLTGYSEIGTDLSGSGVSSSTMSDMEGRLLFELFAAGHARKLRIVIELSAMADVMIEYPVFYHDARRTVAVPETGNTAAVLTNKNRGFRWGVLNLHSTPGLRAVHDHPTVYDYSRFRSMAWSAADSVSNDWYDARELDTLSDMQSQTRAFALPFAESNELKVALVNSYREIPPLACLPRRNEANVWVQWNYTISARARYITNRLNELHLYRVEFDTGGSETGRMLVSTPGAEFGSWYWSVLDISVNNSEVITRWDSSDVNSPKWVFSHNTVGDLGRLTPFHGVTSVVSASGKAGDWISYDILSSGRHARAFADTGTIWIGFASDVEADNFIDLSTSLSGSTPCIRWNRLKTARLWLVYRAGTEIKLDSINEQGVSEMSITVANGEYPALVSARDGRVLVYYVRDSSIKGRIYDSFGNALTSEFTAITTADETAIAADEYILSNNAWRVNLIYRVGGALTLSTSSDGQSFS